MRKRVDREQITFDSVSENLKRETVHTVIEEFPPNIKPQCPYCCTQFTMNEGIILGKKGNIAKKWFMCPKCHAKLRRQTAWTCAKQTLREYAVWVYDVRQWDVNGKLKWSLIKQWLNQNHLSNYFWTYYYEIKNSDPNYLAWKAAMEAEKRNEYELKEYMSQDPEQVNREYREQREQEAEEARRELEPI